MDKDLIILNVKKIINLNEDEASFFKSLLSIKRVQKKEYLLRIGEICRFDYFVTRGCLKVGYIDSSGNEFIVKFAVENYWAVDLVSFLNKTTAFFYLQAIEETDVLQISKANWDLAHQAIPAFHEFSKIRWQDGFVALENRIIQSQSSTAEEKYLRFIEKYPGLEHRIPQKYIAQYLGLTPEFFSVLKKNLLSVNS